VLETPTAAACCAMPTNSSSNLHSTKPGIRLRRALLWRLFILAVLALTTQLTGCAHVARDRDVGVYDPLEPMNRAIFSANIAVDRAVIKPAAKGYRAILPQFVRDRV
jgi:ABC-type transporter lipoprotein component MlaA